MAWGLQKYTELLLSSVSFVSHFSINQVYSVSLGSIQRYWLPGWGGYLWYVIVADLIGREGKYSKESLLSLSRVVHLSMNSRSESMWILGWFRTFWGAATGKECMSLWQMKGRKFTSIEANLQGLWQEDASIVLIMYFECTYHIP